jgi:hypothetical protein
LFLFGSEGNKPQSACASKYHENAYKIIHFQTFQDFLALATCEMFSDYMIKMANVLRLFHHAPTVWQAQQLLPLTQIFLPYNAQTARLLQVFDDKPILHKKNAPGVSWRVLYTRVPVLFAVFYKRLTRIAQPVPLVDINHGSVNAYMTVCPA